MAASEGTETAQMEDVTKSSEKEEPEPINEEQATVQLQEEAPKADENGHQTDEPASEGESKTEETPKDNVDAKQTEEAASEVKNDEDTAKSSENGNEISDKKETAEDKPSEGETEQPKEENAGLAATVSKFYNEHKENTREERKTSPIFYLRNFNNWVKSVLINEFMEKYKRKTFRNLSVLDLACGKGGDLLKWQKARISNLVCADIAEVSIKQCEQRYKDMRYGRNQRRYNQPQRVFDAQFITADCTKENISDRFNNRNSDVQFDMTSCQFSLHYAFESPEQAEKMLENACGRLKPGGYFIGTIPCANEIINRLRQSEGMSFENDCYKITFTEKENFSLFGHKYDFHLEGVVDCPEFLVYFPLLEKMAKKYGLTLELAQGFHHFFEDHKDKDDYRFLLNRMNALETFPPRREGDKPVSDKEDAYTQAKEVLGEEDESDYKKYVGTLSKDEWEAAGLYMAFAFKKAEEPKPTPVEEVKTDVNKTEQSVQQSGETHADKVGEDEKDEEKMEEDEQVEDLSKPHEADENNDENVEGAEEKAEVTDEKGEDADKKGEDSNKESEDADKESEDANKESEVTDEKGEDADKESEVTDEKGEDADKKGEDANKESEDAPNKESEDAPNKESEDAPNKESEDAPNKESEDAPNKESEDAPMEDEGEDKKDESGNKNDDDLDKKDQVAGEVESEERASTDIFQESQAREQEDGGEGKKSTAQRGRRRRSAGAAKDEAGTLEEVAETTPKRGTRKRKSTGGAEEEPPEKKKA